MKLKIFSIAVVILGCFAVNSIQAQENAKGVAFVLAPEQSSGICFSDNADKGFACAREKCTENGTPVTQCLRVKWCYPAGWSADIFMQHRDGIHWHEYLCGWQTRSDLEAAVKLKCGGNLSNQLIECGLVGLWSPKGREIALETEQ
ncbi:MAG: hypothetical protein AAF217_08185 [Pseudomonadota bacterium]